jgi:ATP-dependent protease ClpP protease subunit
MRIVRLKRNQRRSRARAGEISLINPNSDYRLNPKRAIYVTGTLDDEMVARLTPRILTLQNESRDPICVYINSPGGFPRCAEALLNLLRLSNQDIADPCRIITAVTVQAASAAADLLASGDYAIAFPKSTILHHGIRQSSGTPSTLESTGRLNEILRINNSLYAMQLAQKSDDRFTFRFYSVRDEFASLREKNGNPNLSDYECFVQVIEEKLSPDAKKIFGKAVKRAERYKALISSVAGGSGWNEAESPLQVQAVIIKAIVDFEVGGADGTETPDFRIGGMRRLADDFYLLNEYLTGNTNQKLDAWCTTLGRMFLSPEQQAEIDGIANEADRLKRLVEINKPILQPMLSFFIALCHALQEGENELTATDAYWLGLVDEVVGDDNLWNLRLLYEFEDDSEEKANTDGEESTETQAAEQGIENTRA